MDIPNELAAVYEALVQSASTPHNAQNLVLARAEFVRRTGDLFEGDAAYERRLTAFVEWYLFDGASANAAAATPAAAYGQAQGSALGQIERAALGAWCQAPASLLQIRRARAGIFELDDLLLSCRYTLAAAPQLTGLGTKAIIAARVVRWGDTAHITDGVTYFPDAALKVVARVSQAYRRGRVPGVSRLDLLHRLIYLANRCERYRHVEPARIFAEGEAAVVAPT